MKTRKVGIIGSVCDKLDGQTVKTKILYDELKKDTDWDFVIVNTQLNNGHPVKLLLKTIHMLLICKDVFILVSQNGARVYFPMLYYATKILKTRVFHDVIGGSPEDYVHNNPKNKKYLNSFVVNWVETKQMCKGLENIGVYNVESLPNFKRLKCVKKEEFNTNYSEPLPLCTFSRVMKEKGIEDAIKAVENINSLMGRKVYSLDIYGRVDEEYETRFNEIMKKTSSVISYKGTVPYDKSVDTVKRYYALLFPTYWFGEGFPGTIVDAFSSGVPVIATDFSANSEIICNQFTGIIYPNEKIETLEDALIWAMKNPDEMRKMKENCLEEARKYQPDEHIKRIIRKVKEV